MVCYLSGFLKRLVADRRAISAVEYAVLALGIVPLVAFGAVLLGGGVQALLDTVSHAVAAAGHP